MTHETWCRSNCPCCAVDWDCTCGATSHDPLCPGWFDTLDGQAECDACELIAKVRDRLKQAEELTMASVIQRIESLAWQSKGLDSTFSLRFIIQELRRQS